MGRSRGGGRKTNWENEINICLKIASQHGKERFEDIILKGCCEWGRQKGKLSVVKYEKHILPDSLWLFLILPTPAHQSDPWTLCGDLWYKCWGLDVKDPQLAAFPPSTGIIRYRLARRMRGNLLCPPPPPHFLIRVPRKHHKSGQGESWLTCPCPFSIWQGKQPWGLSGLFSNWPFIISFLKENKKGRRSQAGLCVVAEGLELGVGRW